MRMRSLLVAVSAVALMSSGAMAGSYHHSKSISKGKSELTILVIATSDNPFTRSSDPIVVVWGTQESKAEAPPHGSAGADGHAHGDGTVDIASGQNNDGTPDPNNNGEDGTQSSIHVHANGNVDGSACAGWAC